MNDLLIGATLEVIKKDNGTYLVNQREPLQNPKVPDKSREDFNFSFGPLKVRLPPRQSDLGLTYSKVERVFDYE